MICALCGGGVPEDPPVALVILSDGREVESSICRDCETLLLAVGYVSVEEGT